MNINDAVQAIASKGFTERQARFLVLVMRHSGVCVMRQYAAFAGIVFGQKTRRFFDKLVTRGYASIRMGRRHALLFISEHSRLPVLIPVRQASQRVSKQIGQSRRLGEQASKFREDRRLTVGLEIDLPALDGPEQQPGPRQLL